MASYKPCSSTTSSREVFNCLKLIRSCLLLLALMFESSSTQSTMFITGYKGYTEMELGNINLLISVPHDGQLYPVDIQNRTADELNNLKGDFNTRKVAQKLRDELVALFASVGQSARPFMVYNNLHRVKMDPNRNASECCANQRDDSIKAYTDYHSMITNNFKVNFMLNGPRSYRQGLIIDIHGQSHPENWIEIGYLLSSSQLNRTLDKTLRPSVNYLILLNNYDMEGVIRGNLSLGGIMQQKFNLKCVPSPLYPSPNGGNYYSGGFITSAHGSSQTNEYRLNAIQIELPFSMRANDTAVNLSAKQVAASIFEYYNRHSMSTCEKFC
jgi:hypothetical protein